ncbi:No apical meristem (NAM) protein [Corchorus capsularis]|uniref:No apical meristem (NAM) protein n=1 Tax=Corchorus capsularis TaxID=210143 RepID=A0A1R3GMA5_COCAP|nr:No apical meristem (NAM) protein [Corchorus capsularis]
MAIPSKGGKRILMGQLEEAKYRRFRPTDVELLDDFLKRRVVQGRKFATKSIIELDIYKHAPWKLPLTSEDFMWYFFCPAVMKKHGTGLRSSNRASKFGYWKGSGKDRAIKCMGKTMGVMKTLVFYRGKAPNGERTNWVVHEYRLDDEDSYVICVVFQKDNIGPTRGFQYAAQSPDSSCAPVLDADVPSPMSVAFMDDKIVPESTGAPQLASQVQESSFDSSDSYLQYLEGYIETESLNDGKDEEASHQLAMVQELNHYIQSPPLQRDDGECFMYDCQGNDGELALVPQVQEANSCVQSPLQLFDRDHHTFMYDGQGNENGEAPHQLTLLPQVQMSNHNFPSQDVTLVPRVQISNHNFPSQDVVPQVQISNNNFPSSQDVTLVPQVQISNHYFPSPLESTFINEGQGNYGNFPIYDGNEMLVSYESQRNNNGLDSNRLNQDVTRGSSWQHQTQYGHGNNGGSSNFNFQGDYGNFPVYDGDDNSLLLPSYQSQNSWNNNVLDSNRLNQDVTTSSSLQHQTQYGHGNYGGSSNFQGNFPVYDGDDYSLLFPSYQPQNSWNNNDQLDKFNLLDQDVTASSISQPETQGQDNYGGSSNFIQGNCTF